MLTFVATLSNIGVKAQTNALRSALAFLALSLALSIVLVRTDVVIWYRIALFVPFSLASISLYQALFKT